MKMKTLIALMLLVAAAHGLSIDPVITLREYLDSLNPADPTSKREEGDCATKCGHPAHLNLEASCASTRWRPNYSMKDGCECLTDYQCCPAVCPTVDVKSCWGVENVAKGLMYGETELDCCGCNAVKCKPCPEVDPKHQVCPTNTGARPLDCYTYKAHHHYAADPHNCWRPNCDENETDAPTDEVCDPRCEKDDPQISHCLFPYNKCAAKIVRDDCPKVTKGSAIAELSKPLHCFEEPAEVVDETGGHYYHTGDDECKKCTKWVYDPKSCAPKNAITAAADCHKFGNNNLDKTCFTKDLTRDECGCDDFECIFNDKSSEDKFIPGEVCPKQHIKVSGTSICDKPRDVCKKCPDPTRIDDSDCVNGKVKQVTDCNGCKYYVCERAEIPTEDCDCGKYQLDQETNLLACHCTILVPQPLHVVV